MSESQSVTVPYHTYFPWAFIALSTFKTSHTEPELLLGKSFFLPFYNFINESSQRLCLFVLFYFSVFFYSKSLPKTIFHRFTIDLATALPSFKTFQADERICSIEIELIKGAEIVNAKDTKTTSICV